MTTRAFTDEIFKQFRTDFKLAIAELEKKYDISIKLGNISYKSAEFTSKITAVKNDVYPFTDEAEHFKVVYAVYGLELDMLDKTFVANGKTLKFVGVDGRKKKFPCICIDINDNNQRYKLSCEQLRNFFNNSVISA